MSILTCFFAALIPYAASITFNYSNITPNNSPDILLSGNAAYTPDDGIQLTQGSVWLAGRATYIELLHLWDKESNDLASFSTSFTFVIDSYPNNNYADGLTFFLAQNNSWINAGGYLGLPIDSATKKSVHRFAAVEFDTFGGNDWDPKDPDTNNPIDDHVASTGNQFEKHNIISWTFNSTEFKVNEDNRKNYKLRMTVLLTAGTLVLVTCLVILAYFLWRRNKTDGDEGEELGLLEMNNEFEMGASTPRRFSYKQLARSTTDFAESEKLGEGGFGGVYKCFLKELGTYVAVKRVSKTSKQGFKEYASEVRIISRLRHKNLVQLIGWCHDKGELLLAYEFLENGSLDLHLFNGKSLLTWITRYKIAHGLASALLYLHEEWEQCVLRRDIKSSNVMLDSNFNAKLGDFGLAKLVDHEKGAQTTMLAGTLGYMAPECVVTGRSTKESDVFSFGVVVLEIACGRKSINYKAQEKQMQLLEWVWELYGKGSLSEAIDPSLGPEFEEEEIKRLMIVGLWCVHPDYELRPSMRQAIKVPNSDASLPLLPSKMSVASYMEPLVSSLPVFSSICQYESLSLNVNESTRQTKALPNSSPQPISVLNSRQ
ncbi:L-type lectin-domain containing receptor kinase IX.1-like [Bidens hawaiensis]|uniref:L-type lectin-domain containing receptor kinase IX.1-like n=1 Tax=Bidens hawaiensis TaxID=980011 RepID=UPI00404AD470